MSKKKKAPTSKPTHEKPLTLHPLEFEDALRGLLAVKPPQAPQKKDKSTDKPRDIKS